MEELGREKNIEPEDFLQRMDSGELHDSLVLDVREPDEWEYYHLEGTLLFPMNTIPGRLGEIPRDRDVYVVCAHGIRSEMVCRFLRGNGFAQVINVHGGMAALARLRGFAYD
jgi:rhodanese-related sulfurtransferase